jgi:predicted nucleic acid-binding protein
MGTVLVDSNVILDIARNDETWQEWSSAALAEAADRNVLAINALIYAEVSIGFERIEDLEEALPGDVYQRATLPYEAAFLAGKCFLDYRRRGGVRSAPLPDFYIGAHAAVSGYTLLTRGVRRFRTYFPTVPVIAPPPA